MTQPLAIDLFCGLGGWTEGLLAAGYYVVGFDIERHHYGEHRYPAHLVIQDVLTLHGAQFKDAALIVASPPCQGYSYRAMPWSRAKALPPPDNTLFEACFRIQREACEAAERHIPMIVENVRGAQRWVGRARWNFGSFYLWGDVPALMPIRSTFKNSGGSWFAIANNTTSGHGRNPVSNSDYQLEGAKNDGSGWRENGTLRSCNRMVPDGLKLKDIDGYDRKHPRALGWKIPATSSKSTARKAASVMIAKIPFALSRYIAVTYIPQEKAPGAHAHEG